MNIAHQGLFQVKGAVEAVGFQHIADAAVEALRCPATVFLETVRGAIPLVWGGVRRCQAVLDAQFGAELVECVRAGWGARP